jgi:hypothetical protein
MFPPREGGLEYFQHISESRRGRREWNPVPEIVTGPSCHWGT